MESNLNKEIPVLDLDPVIAESKQIIQDAEPKPRRGRGRPPGSLGNKTKPSETGPVPSAPGPAAASHESQFDVVPMLKTTWSILSKIPAERVGIPALAFDDNESQAMAQASDMLMKAYIPDLNNMSPKTAAWLSFGVTSTSIMFVKLQVINEHRAKINSERLEKPDTTTNGASAPTAFAETFNPGTHADAFYRRPGRH